MAAPDFTPPQTWVRDGKTFARRGWPSSHVALGPAWETLWSFLDQQQADTDVSLTDLFHHLKSMGHHFKLETVRDMLLGEAVHRGLVMVTREREFSAQWYEGRGRRYYALTAKGRVPRDPSKDVQVPTPAGH
jgi:hypothetical protein